ncbi:MAG: glycosyltransferase [Actinomycetota bacterium]|nr:glycosyltransferase [Actinomycetota bacterium]
MAGIEFGIVLLTMGRRTQELQEALLSIQNQKGVSIDLLIVGNGWNPAQNFPQIRSLYLPENLGIPAGRNRGANLVNGEYLFFLDDDALLSDPYTFQKMKNIFEKNEKIGLIQPRVLSTQDGEPTPNRWVPRLRIGDPKRSSVATSLWEGACAIRTSLFIELEGWPDNFFYAHEGIDLVWGVFDKNFLPWYAAEIEVKHPVINPKRHGYYFFLNARNRVWLAKRNLRFPFSFLYPFTWILITLARVGNLNDLKPWFSGLFSGIFTTSVNSFGQNTSKRKKLKWSTHLKLIKYGRPPII